MIAAAQQTPRPWDGRRVLRFLTSLAMLALAVTLRLPGPASPAAPVDLSSAAPPAASVTAGPAPDASATTPGAAETSADAGSAARSAGREQEATEPASPVAADDTAATAAAPRLLPAGETPQHAGPRAPPAA